MSGHGSLVAIPSNRVKRSKGTHGDFPRRGPGVAIPSNRVKRSKLREGHAGAGISSESQSPQIGSSVQRKKMEKISYEEALSRNPLKSGQAFKVNTEFFLLDTV